MARTARYQVNICFNEEETEMWDKARKKVGFTNKQVALLGAETILEQENKIISDSVKIAKGK